jgi:NAD(P)H-hydrate epimerase
MREKEIRLALVCYGGISLAVYLHGLAGDLAAAELSQPALIASDLPRFLGPAWLKLLELRAGARG